MKIKKRPENNDKRVDAQKTIDEMMKINSFREGKSICMMKHKRTSPNCKRDS